ncbi:MAG: hypothetical protein AAGC63_10565 [Propionicimonas sp.]|nr:hypothetical protein [Propionicimonas sp.]
MTVPLGAPSLPATRPDTALSPTLGVLTIAVTALTLTTSLLGLLAGWPYAAETANWRLQAQAQDLGNLPAVAVLLGGWLAARRGSVRGVQAWLGALLYLAYAFALYAVGIHFGALFLPYVAVLGLSLYSAGFGMAPVAGRIRLGRAAARPARVTLGVVSCLFAGLWLGGIASALATGQTPGELAETGLPSNPVHVLDLALVLPAMLLTAVRSGSHRRARFLLAPWLVFSTLMGASIVALMALTAAPGPGLAIVGAVTVASGVAAVTTIRRTAELAAGRPGTARRGDSADTATETRQPSMG